MIRLALLAIGIFALLVLFVNPPRARADSFFSSSHHSGESFHNGSLGNRRSHFGFNSGTSRFGSSFSSRSRSFGFSHGSRRALNEHRRRFPRYTPFTHQGNAADNSSH